jgi:hypothetical protein
MSTLKMLQISTDTLHADFSTIPYQKSQDNTVFFVEGELRKDMPREISCLTL